MTEFKHKELEGSLFLNNFKERDQHPDYTGKLVVEGKTYQIACWKNQTKSGSDYFKLKLSDDEPQRRPDSQSYKSVGKSIPSKHMREYEKAKKQVDETFSDIPKDEDIPF